MTTQRTKTVFKRIERDGEFHVRLRAVGLLQADYYSETALDDYAWAQRRMQRRIVDDFA